MNVIKNKSAFRMGKRHYILCGDEEGMKDLASIKVTLLNHRMSFEEIHLSRCSPAEMDSLLGMQKMGTYLYVAAEGEKVRELLDMADKLGYSSEEAQFIRVGEIEKKIFCCKCHGISIVKGTMNKSGCIICSACAAKLELSDHYSPIKDAYLGYVAPH